ncbi:hypothetical protein [Moraxella lacunata]
MHALNINVSSRVCATHPYKSCGKINTWANLAFSFFICQYYQNYF